MLASIQTGKRFAAAKLFLPDNSSNSIAMDMNKCIACNSCVVACQNVAGQNILEPTVLRGKKIVKTTTGKLLADTKCIGCGQCTFRCKFGALKETDAIEPVLEQLRNKNGKICITQIAPAIRINMAEALGVPAGTISTGKVVTALKMIGFDYVFETNFGADMTIVEEATEFLERLKNQSPNTLPMFTSCCPAWVNYVEKNHHELIPHLSTTRSPIGILCSVIKNVLPLKLGIDSSQIFNTIVVPCTAKKDEIKRPQLRTKDGKQETDYALTSRELAQMIKMAKINFQALEDTPFDNIYSEATGGGAIFCATGGVMEAALRSAYKFTTKKDMTPIEFTPIRGVQNGIKKGTINLDGKEINVAVAQGIKNAMMMIDNIQKKVEGYENIQFAEVMACPGGCVGGGGSPRAGTTKTLEKRLEATYQIDKASTHRTPQDNEQMNALYKEYLGGSYGSHIAHELAHTYFTERE